MVKFIPVLMTLLVFLPSLTWAQPTPSGPSSVVQSLQQDASANGNGVYMGVAGYNTVGVTVSLTTGTPTFTVNFEGAAYEGSNINNAPNNVFQPIQCFPANGSALTTTATGAGHWRCNVTGISVFRARVSGYTGPGQIRVVGVAIQGGLTDNWPDAPTFQTLGLATPLGVPSGGTGAGTYPLNQFLQGNGTSPITSSANPLLTSTGSTTARGLADRAADPFNIKDYGAKCDGATDDTAAIQATVTAAGATPQSGALVWIPTGTCLFSSTITIGNTKFVPIVGTGLSSLLRWTGGGSTTMFQHAGVAPTGTYSSLFQDFQLQDFGNAGAGNQVGLSGITFGTSAGTGVNYNIVIRRVVFNKIETGVKLWNETDEANFYDSWFTGGTNGVVGSTSGGCISNCATSTLTFVGNHFQNLSSWAINISRGTRITVFGNTIQSDTAGAKGVLLDATSAPLVLSNFVEWQTNPTGTAISINPTASGGDSLGGGLIAGNTINLNNAATGILVGNIAGLRVGSNAFRLVTTAITLQSTSSLITVEPQSAGTGVTTMLSDLRVDNGNLANAEMRTDALKVRGTLTALAPLTLTTAAGPIIAMSGTTVAGQYMNLINTGANLQFGIESSAGGAFVTGDAAYSTFLNTGNSTPLAFGTNNTLRGTFGTTGGMTLGVAPTGGAQGSGTLNIATADGYLVNNTALKNISETLSNKTIASPVLSGSATGTYTLAGTPTITSPAISGPTLSGTVAGTPTWGSGQNFPSLGLNTAADATTGTIKGVVGISSGTTAAKNLRGSCTFAAATTCTVTFGTAEPDTTYFIALGCNNNKTFWWTSKGTGGFTLNANASSSDTCDWHLLR